MTEDIIRDEKISVDWSIPGLRKPGDFVESWRILLWDRAFSSFFGSKDSKLYHKKTNFKEYPGTAEAVKRVVYRWVPSTKICSNHSF